jgi:hypothetical protein
MPTTNDISNKWKAMVQTMPAGSHTTPILKKV